jgi:dipeptidyl aminopeptidase/acylaminoacyl peptidase
VSLSGCSAVNKYALMGCLLLLNACNFSTTTPGTVSPSSTPAQEDLSTPTVSPISPEGPWLVYIGDDNRAYVVNRDGTGLASLTDHYTLTVTGSSVSNRLAFISSKTNKFLPVLSIMDLPSRNVLSEIPLLSFFTQSAENLDDGTTGPLNGIRGRGPSSVIQWSPDGRYLAFMGAIETPLSSLHIYDNSTGAIKKLSQNIHQAVNPVWSPDGQWIVYEEVSSFHGWLTEGIWAASVDSAELKLLYKPEDQAQQEILGWVGDDSLIVADGGVRGPRNIRAVNVKTGEVKTLFAGYYLGMSLDTKNGAVAFFPMTGAPGAALNMETGIYLVSPEITNPKLVIPTKNPVPITWYSETELFMSGFECNNQSDMIIAFNSTGDTSCVLKPKPNISPDGRWYIVLDGGLDVYKADGDRSGGIPGIMDGSIIWEPDSEGFFIRTKEEIFHVSLPDLTLRDVYYGKYFNYIWAGVH